jgi:hypothetical protein
MRQMVENTDTNSILGDPAKMAAAIVSIAGQPSAPLRLTLGSDAYQLVRGALQARLAALDAQVAIAQSTDAVRCRHMNLVQKVLDLASKDASSPLHGLTIEEIVIRNGRICRADDQTQGEAYTEILARHR